MPTSLALQQQREGAHTVIERLIDIAETMGMQAERLQVARKMLQHKKAQGEVRKFTGLTKKELYKLLKELKPQ